MKQPQPMTLELAIRALVHEKRTFPERGANTPWRSGYDSGYLSGLEHAIQTLRNLDAANRQPGKDTRP